MNKDELWLARRNKEQHARTRIMERFGITLTLEEKQEIERQIENYENWPVYISDRDGKSFHHFVVQGVSMVFLYDWEFSVILTVYRKKWFDRSDPKSWKLRPRKRKKKPKRKNRVFDEGLHPNRFR